MHITSRYIGTSLENFNYLFFLLTEDYIEEHKEVQASIGPALMRFGRSIGDKGALVRPFPGDELATLEDFKEKNWSNDQIVAFRIQLPAIFIIDVAFDLFDARKCNYLVISLRDSMDQFGRVRIFEVEELFSALAKACFQRDLFREFVGASVNQVVQSLFSTVEIKPGIFGITVDIKAAVAILWELVGRGKCGQRLYPHCSATT